MLVGEAVAQAKRHLGGDKDRRNKLDAAVTATAEQLTLTYPTTVSLGSILEVGAERLYVWDEAAGTVTVERGFDGTDPAAHDAGDLVAVDPRFPGALLEMAAELEDLSAEGLADMKQVTLTYDHVDHGVSLASLADRLGVYGVEVTRSSSPRWLSPREWHEDESLLRFYEPPEDGTARVYYWAPFAALGGPESDLGATGLPSHAFDLLTVGTAVRLLAGKEAGRVDFESASGQRRAEEVAPGDAGRAARLLAAKRDQLLNAALARQERRWPTRA